MKLKDLTRVIKDFDNVFVIDHADKGKKYIGTCLDLSADLPERVMNKYVIAVTHLQNAIAIRVDSRER